MGYDFKTKNEPAVRGGTVKYSIDDVKEYPCLAIPERNITQKTAEHFGVRTEIGEETGAPVAHYFPYTDIDTGEIIAYKRRDITKGKKDKGHFTVVGQMKIDRVSLFGTTSGNASGGKKVFCTEGEYDCMISHQCLKDRYPRANPTVLSIGFGTANAVHHIGQKKNTQFLKKFSEVVLAFDNDRATAEEKEKKIMKGVEATAAVYGLIPEVLVAQLPDGKDPCETYLEDGEEQLYWMLMKPVRFTPEGFVSYSEVRDKAIELPTIGKPWPWPSVTKKTLGRRLGEGIYFGAGVKMGKSVIADTLTEHIIKNEKNKLGEPQKVAMFKFEEQPDETLKKVAGKFYRKAFDNPEKIIFINAEGAEVDVWGNQIQNNETFFTHRELIDAVDSIGNQIILYNNYGRCNWDELKGAIRHAVLVEHVEDIFIDPITRLTAGMSASQANEELERFADEISKMSQDLGFTYYCFCHLKSPAPPSKPHEMGGKVFSSQFRGSRAMMQACHYMIGLEGNKDPEQPHKVQNTRYLCILDDRKFGRTARVPLFYDEDTGNFDEPPKGFLEDDSIQTLTDWYSRVPEEILEDF